MRRVLARSLWFVAAAQLTLAGCAQKSADERERSIRETSGATDTAVATKEEHDKLKKQLDGRAGAGSAVAAGTIAPMEMKLPAGGAPSMPYAPPPPPITPTPKPDSTSGEDFTDYGENPMTDTAADNLSTFAVDVDTASYSIARRKIHEGVLPPQAAVRVEEWLNYFKYDLAGPADGGAPFAVHMDAAPSPFTKGRHVVRVALATKQPTLSERKKANLVFLVDVSGSMQSPDKLELAKRSLRLLVDNLRDGDTVSLVTYAGATRIVLEPTGLEHKAQIHAAIEDLTAGGSTAMGAGIDLAYQMAAKHLSSDSISRVIVLSDGDANVGNSTHEEILATIADKVKEGVTLSTVGFGLGNYKDTLMEQLANKGNGNNVYIDGLSQAKRVFAEQLGATLDVVAQDVKLQVEWNKEAVKSYRLIGYENRDIRDVDFRDDKVDAGEIGAGHAVTALYEVELRDAKQALATVHVRHKAPRGTTASEQSFAFDAAKLAGSFDGASADLRWAIAVAATADVLRGSKDAAGWKLEDIRAIARAAAGDSAERAEMLDLLDRVIAIKQKVAIAD